MVSDLKLRKAQPRGKRYTIALGESLYLRVFPTGVKSYVLRYASGGKVRDITLGRCPALNLAQARQAARLKRSELKIKPSRGMTFTDAFRLWKAKKRHTLSSYRAEVRRIEKHLLPALGGVALDEVTAPLALQVLRPMESHPATLRRCLMRLNECLDLAVCAGYITANPCRGLSRIFAPHQAVNRPFIPASELGKLFQAVAEAPEWFRLFTLWAVYCMLRPVECVSVRWSWIEGDVLILPAEIMKKRHVHRVPLCPGALALLARIKALRKRRSAVVWCFGRGGQTVNRQALTKYLQGTALKGKLCHHGLRATGRTWMRDRGIAHDVAEDALAHLSGSATERAYLRGDYLEQRRQVMADWWDFIYTEYCKVCEAIPM